MRLTVAKSNTDILNSLLLAVAHMQEFTVATNSGMPATSKPTVMDKHSKELNGIGFSGTDEFSGRA